MFKKIMLTTLSVFMLFGLVFAGNADSESPRRDSSAILGDGALRNIYIHRVTSSGHILNESELGELGSPTYYWLKAYIDNLNVNTITMTTGYIQMKEHWIDLPARNLDLFATTNIQIETNTFTTGITSTTADFSAFPIYGRNLVLIATFTAGTSSAAIIGTAIVYGTNTKGIATSETISFTTLNYLVDSSTTSGVGNVSWISISSITLRGSCSNLEGVAQDLDLHIRLGTGNKIGLANDIIYNTDIYRVNEAGSNLTTATINTTYDTIDFVTDGNDSNDYFAYYKVSVIHN